MDTTPAAQPSNSPAPPNAQPASANGDANGRAGAAPIQTNSKALDDFLASFLNGEVKDVCSQQTKTGGGPIIIKELDSRHLQSPGFHAHRDLSLKQLVSQRLKRSLDQLGTFSLCRPAIYQRYAMIATDDSEAPDHFLMCIDTQLMQDDGKADPIVECVPVSEHIRDIRWIANDTILCASGDGHILVYSVSDDRKLKFRGSIVDAHSSEIREMAVNLANPTQIASGGFDKKLCVLDLQGVPRVVDSIQLGATIGSVKWPTCNQSVCVSVTLDSGHYMLFDLRTRIGKPTYQANFGKKELYTHERYSDFHVLVGFGDGEIKHIDMRSAKTILSVGDPYVEGIGGIEYNHVSRAFVATGFTDFSVWKCGADSSARVWSHGHQDPSVSMQNTNNYCTAAAWLQPTSVLVSTSTGNLGIYTQDWAALSRGK